MGPAKLFEELRGYGLVEFLVVLFLIVLFGALLGDLSFVREFDSDEFQHIQMAWLISTGAIPYKDFFEHHTPLYHFALVPFFTNPLLQTDGLIAFFVVLSLRIASVGASIATLLLTYVAAKKIGSGFAGITAMCLLAGSSIFIEKGIEIRPDVIATVFLLFCSILLLQEPKMAADNIRVFVISILATGAVLTTQKALFAIPGLLASAALRHYPLNLLKCRHMFSEFSVIILAGILAVVPIRFYFFLHDALWDLLYYNLFLGAKWDHNPCALARVLGRLLRQDAILVVLGLCGVYACLQKRECIPIAAPLISMVLFMPIFPVVQRQYVFCFSPIWLSLEAWEQILYCEA